MRRRDRGVVVAASAFVALAACAGEERLSGDTPADQAPRAAASPPASPPAQSPAAPRSGAVAAGPARAPAPTAQDSAAGAREDLSPEWKMNERRMAPYTECMAQASTTPEHVRARLQAACANRPGAPAH